MSDTDRDALADLLEDVEYESRYAIAAYLTANRAAVLRALGLREDYMGFSVEDGEPTYKRYVTRWEDVTE